MKHLKQLVLVGVVAAFGLAVLAPTSAFAAAKKCHWDKKTGRMVCQRPAR
ncbi:MULTISPECIES: hypothetical protein [unclassified Variovorax]|nr:MULTISPECIES: hypothetical protein [unclassified Variovorax]